MPSSKLPEFTARLSSLEKKMTEHLIESTGIRAHLKINTWLTGLILAALLARFISTWFRG